MRQQELQLRAGDYLKDDWAEAYASYDGRPLMCIGAASKP
jgi:hypothetical protein